MSLEAAGVSLARPARASRRLARGHLLAAVALLALATGFVRIGRKSLWMDEGISADHAHVGLRSLLHVLTGGDPNMGLYYVLLHVWTRVFGESEVAIRSLSALFAVGAVVAVYLLGERLFGRRAAFAAGALLALNVFFVRFAQEARSYSLLVLLVTVSSYFFVAELERPSRASVAGYVVVSTLAVYAHYFACFVLLAQAVTLVAVRRRAVLTKRWLGAFAAVALLSVPELFFAQRKGAANALGWITQPSFRDLEGAPMFLTNGSHVLFAAFVVLGCYGIVRGRRDDGPWRYGFLAVWVVLPIVGAFAISFVQPVFESRYLIICLPPFVLLVGNGLARIPLARAAAVTAVALLAVSAVKLDAWYRAGSRDDWRGAVRYLIDAGRPGDTIVLAPSWARGPVAYYERREHGRALPPADASRAARIWVVRWVRDQRPAASLSLPLERAIARTHRVARLRGFTHVTVELFAPRAG